MGTFVRSPIERIVVRGGGAGQRPGTSTPWEAKVYDAKGNLRSRVSDVDRGYVERKLEEFYPGVPVEWPTTPTLPPGTKRG